MVTTQIFQFQVAERRMLQYPRGVVAKALRKKCVRWDWESKLRKYHEGLCLPNYDINFLPFEQ